MDVREECVGAAEHPKLGQLKNGDSFLYEGHVHIVIEALRDSDGAVGCVDLRSGQLKKRHANTDVLRVNQFEVVLKR